MLIQSTSPHDILQPAGSFYRPSRDCLLLLALYLETLQKHSQTCKGKRPPWLGVVTGWEGRGNRQYFRCPEPRVLSHVGGETLGVEKVHGVRRELHSSLPQQTLTFAFHPGNSHFQ